MREVYEYIQEHIDDLEKDKEYVKEYVEGQINLAVTFKLITIEQAFELNKMLK